MPHPDTTTKRSRRGDRKSGKRASKVESRYTVGLAPGVASQVARYAETVDMSMSKGIAALVRIGLESQEDRKRDFFGCPGRSGLTSASAQKSGRFRRRICSNWPSGKCRIPTCPMASGTWWAPDAWFSAG